MLTTTPNCVEQLHVCMRDTFQVNFFDELTIAQEYLLPKQLEWCVEHGTQ